MFNVYNIEGWFDFVYDFKLYIVRHVKTKHIY